MDKQKNQKRMTKEGIDTSTKAPEEDNNNKTTRICSTKAGTPTRKL